MGGGDNGCGIQLLGVTSNKLVTFPRQNSIRPSGSCCPSGECNYYVSVCVYVCVVGVGVCVNPSSEVEDQINLMQSERVC